MKERRKERRKKAPFCSYGPLRDAFESGYNIKRTLQSNKKKTDNPIASWLKYGKPLHKRKSTNDQYV